MTISSIAILRQLLLQHDARSIVNKMPLLCSHSFIVNSSLIPTLFFDLIYRCVVSAFFFSSFIPLWLVGIFLTFRPIFFRFSNFYYAIC